MKLLRNTCLLAIALALPAPLAGCNSERATAEGGGAAVPARDDAGPNDAAPAATATADRATRPAHQIVETTFDTFSFDIQPDEPFNREMLGPEIEALAGRRIRIRGYILPTPQKRGIKQFVLVRDNQECCFGPGAALYDCVLVHMQPGCTAEFSIRPVAVEGTLAIEVYYDFDDRARAVYRLDAEAVR